MTAKTSRGEALRVRVRVMERSAVADVGIVDDGSVATGDAAQSDRADVFWYYHAFDHDTFSWWPMCNFALLERMDTGDRNRHGPF